MGYQHQQKKFLIFFLFKTINDIIQEWALGLVAKNK